MGNIELNDLLKHMIERKASDLHLKCSRPPILRINKELIITDFPQLSGEDIKRLAYLMMNENQTKIFENDLEIDFAFVSKDIGRFRTNIFKQRGDIGVVMRFIKEGIPTIKDLQLPDGLEKIALSEKGMILIVGASSTGKSTTLASMVDFINQNKKCHILTLENPIEYLYHDKKAVINQREIGLDAESFKRALRHIIRQDPDVIVIGEMRDAETVQTAISASETGHLIFSSFHAEDVPQAINRLLGFFPAESREQLRFQLGINIRAIICQKLLRCLDGVSLVPAVEILVNNSVSEKLIKTNKLEKLDQLMQTSSELGMQTFNQSLVKLLKEKRVSLDEALAKTDSPEALKINIKGIYLDDQKSILG